MSGRGVRGTPSALSQLQREVSALFQRLALLDRPERLPGSEWFPAVDVVESHDRVVVVVEVPGVAPESLRVVFRERFLVVSGERGAFPGATGVSFHCLERPHGRFERTIPLDGPLDVRQSRATLGSGLLKVAVPRLRERRGHEHTVVVERETE